LRKLGDIYSKKHFLVYLVILSTLFSSYSIISTSNVQANYSHIPSNLDLIPHSKIQNQSPSDDYLSIYNSVTNVSNSGSNFVAHDHLNVEQDLSLNFTYNDLEDGFTADYTISSISGYSDEFLNYGIQEIRAKKDYYTIEDQYDDYQIILQPLFYIAQGFEIPWSNASFYGALLNLDAIGGSAHTGTNEIELFVVKANETTGLPDLSTRLSNELNGPYSRTNPLPAPGNTVFYDFEDTILNQGLYYVVMNLTNSDSTASKKFAWSGHLESSGSGGDTYYYFNDTDTWSLEEIDHTLSVQVLPCDEYGVARIFEDLSEISLQDNTITIQSFTDSISSTGLHHLISDTSIEVDLINKYTFYQEKIASSSFSAYNSTFDSYSIDWNFTWTIGVVDYSPYSTLNRSQLLFVPNDWYLSPTAQNNSSPIYPVILTSEGYEFYLGDSPDASTLTLQTSSPNYLQTLSLADGTGPSDTFTLGYWTNDGSIAYGHEGDIVYAEINIKNLENTGEANFTVFNPEGNINPIKSLAGNLSYTDISPYTQASITSNGFGVYSTQISFDPSVYGSDPAGFWTAFAFWTNGTEIGIYSIKMSVQYSIIFDASWETLPSNNIWTSDDSQTILRKNGDSLDVKASYFSNSEPFFTEFGTPIENASIGYLTSWNLEGYLDEYPLEFNGTIPIIATAGLRTITLILNDSFSIQEMVNIQIEIFNEFSIEPVQQTIEVNNSEEVVLAFSMMNETDIMKGLILPDTVSIKINNNPLLSEELYSVYNQSGIVYVNINLAGYGISSGNANITLDITKVNFKSSYTDDVISVSFSVVVSAGVEPPLPLYAIIIIVVSIFAVITFLAILATVISRRKQFVEIMDIHDQSKVVGLLESVLALKKILILHTETSLPVFEMDIGEKSTVESTLVSGFLAALTQMGSTISGTEAGEIRKLEYRNFVVSSARSETYTIYLFSTDDIIKEVQTKLFDIVMWFEYSFPIKEPIWDGRIEVFQERRNLIQDKVADSLYVWMYFPLRFNQSKSGDIRKLDKTDLKIALFVKKKEEARISELITKYQDDPIEETLTSIFSLVNKGFLERTQFSSYTKKK